MNEQELRDAIEEIRQYRELGMTVEQVKEMQMDYCAKSVVLEEYKAIGTVEECRGAVEKQRKLAEWGCTVGVIQNYKIFEDECIQKGFTFKSLLEAREKQMAKKADRVGNKCPVCKCYLASEPIGDYYCFNCGQAIDWSEVE